MKRIGIALGLFLTATAAMAQQFPTVPAQTVIGRLGTPGDSGPSSAIPLSVLLSTRPLPAGQIIVGNGSGLQANVPLTGDCTMSSAGAITCPKANGVLFGTMATQNANSVAITGGSITGTTVASGSVTYTPPGTGAVATTVDAALHRGVWIKDFGAVCDGSTNDTTAIQNAWNYAATIGANVWLGNVGVSCVITQLTMPTPTAILPAGGFGPARASMLKGPGKTQVTLLSNVTGTNCAITIAATYGVNGSIGGSFSGFGLRQSAGTKVGNGICMTGITKAALEDVMISQFGNGFQGLDTILIDIDRCYFSFNATHMTGNIITNSNPNSWNITRNHFDGSSSAVIALTGPQETNIIGNDFESNGLVAGTTATTIVMTQINLAPTIAMNIIGNYFENNQGTEISISQNGFATKSINNIKGNTFQRTTVNQVAGVLLANNGGASAYTVMNVGGNAFLDNTGAGSYNFLGTTLGTANFNYKCTSDPNITVPSTEISATCNVTATGFN